MVLRRSKEDKDGTESGAKWWILVFLLPAQATLCRVSVRRQRLTVHLPCGLLIRLTFSRQQLNSFEHARHHLALLLDNLL